MVQQGSGPTVNVSFWAGAKVLGNALYGVAKCATDRLTADMAHDLAGAGVTVVSLYPGMVRTEKVLEAAAFLDSRFGVTSVLGRAVGDRAADPKVERRSVRPWSPPRSRANAGRLDVDGRCPTPLTLDNRAKNARAALARAPDAPRHTRRRRWSAKPLTRACRLDVVQEETTAL